MYQDSESGSETIIKVIAGVWLTGVDVARSVEMTAEVRRGESVVSVWEGAE